MRRYLAAVLWLALCAGCDGSEYRVVVRFDPEALGDDVERVEVALVESCAAQSRAGGDPISAIREIAITRDGARGTLGQHGAGRYGLYARGRDDGCDVIVAGCEDVRLEEGGGGDLVVTVSAVSGPGCPSGARCAAGGCETDDAGPGDAGPGDARVPDGGPDGGPVCSCVACARCDPDGACTPDHTLCASDEYCDVAGGCTPADRCDGDAECADDGNPCTTERCDTSRAPAVCTTDPAAGCVSGGACMPGDDPSACGAGGEVCTACDATACPPTFCAGGACAPPGATTLDMRSVHVCAVAGDGSLWCWGFNDSGQLGVGDTVDRDLPARVGTDDDWRSVGLGQGHTCAIKTDGSLWCWGEGEGGRLGLGTTMDHSTPQRVGTATSWVFVDAAFDDTCALQSDDSLWCWGTTSGSSTPVRVVASGIAQVSMRSGHLCTVHTDGSLWCWGQNTSGELGIGTASLREPSVRVGTDSDWQMATVGGSTAGFTCAIRTSGSLWCWGENASGQLGLGDATDRHDPTRVGADTDWQWVHAGAEHACAIKTDGSLWCWGDPSDGRTGGGSSSRVPTRVGADTYDDVRAGYRGTCALRRAGAGTVWCFGANANGELGDGTPAGMGSSTPRRSCL